MSQFKDKTLLDNNRTLLNLHRADIDEVLPEFFASEYPNLIEMFNSYYEWMDSSDKPMGQIQRLYASRDATQVPEPLLQYLEDELLLGQSYFGGFVNKREAIKRSNLLYRSKGTKYSIEQFFRGFYGIDPQVIYPKENIFKIGPAIDFDQDSTNLAGNQIKEEASRIGPESRKYITDDKLYQVMSILIRVGIPFNQWKDVYKLFAHPAGVYLGAELLLEFVNTNILTLIQDEVGTPPEAFFTDTYTGLLAAEGFVETSYLAFTNNAHTTMERQQIEQDFGRIGYRSIEQMDLGYSSQRELLSFNSLTLDDSATQLTMSQDSDGTVYLKATLDQHRYSTLFDSTNSADSAHYPFQHI